MASPVGDGISISRIEEDELKKKEEKRLFSIKAAMFLAGVTLASAIGGFSTTVAAVKKREHEVLAAAGFPENKVADVLAQEAGSRLALRALGWGTVIAVTGVSFICYAGWKISGATTLEEFRLKVGGILPRIPKAEKPGRSEFSSFQDFVDYISQPEKPKAPSANS